MFELFYTLCQTSDYLNTWARWRYLSGISWLRTLLIKSALEDPVWHQDDESEGGNKEYSDVITDTQVEENEEIIVVPQEFSFQLTEHS